MEGLAADVEANDENALPANADALHARGKTYKLPRAACEHCHGSFALKVLERHKMVCAKAGERRMPTFPCMHPRCGKTFARADKLKTHVDENHKFVCAHENCVFSCGVQHEFDDHKIGHLRAGAEQEASELREAYVAIETRCLAKEEECKVLEAANAELRAALAAAQAVAVAAVAESARLRAELERAEAPKRVRRLM